MLPVSAYLAAPHAWVTVVRGTVARRQNGSTAYGSCNSFLALPRVLWLSHLCRLFGAALACSVSACDHATGDGRAVVALRGEERTFARDLAALYADNDGQDDPCWQRRARSNVPMTCCRPATVGSSVLSVLSVLCAVSMLRCAGLPPGNASVCVDCAGSSAFCGLNQIREKQRAARVCARSHKSSVLSLVFCVIGPVSSSASLQPRIVVALPCADG